MNRFGLIWAPRVLLAIVALLTTSCQQQPYKSAVGEIEMGPTQSFKGVWATGFEMSSFTYCGFGFENCRSAGRDIGCWLEGDGSSESDFGKFLSLEKIETGRSYVEFVGRESLKRGSYGHLGQYSCLVEVQKITRVKPIEESEPVELTK